MNNFKKIIARNFILFPSFVLFAVSILFLYAGVNKTPMNAECFLDYYGAVVVGVLIIVSIAGVFYFFTPPKGLLSKTLFLSFFLSSVIVAMLFLKYFGRCKRSHFDSKVGVVCEDVHIDKDEIDAKKSNNEQEIWKKCTHLLAGFSFEYPDYLKITKEYKQYNYWQIKTESPDFYYKDKRNLDIASGFELSITANPITDMTFTEFKNWVDPKDPNRNRDGILWVESNNRQFFTHKFEEESNTADSENIFYYSLDTLYKPNLIISVAINGTEKNKEKMKMILDHFIESLK